MRTINSKSIKEYLNFRPVKGEFYRIVSRKYPNSEYIDKPIILDNKNNSWISPKESSIVFCLDTTPTQAPSATVVAMATATATEAAMVMQATRPMETQWDQWWKSFYKVLYQEKICLVHVSWLEK